MVSKTLFVCMAVIALAFVGSAAACDQRIVQRIETPCYTQQIVAPVVAQVYYQPMVQQQVVQKVVQQQVYAQPIVQRVVQQQAYAAPTLQLNVKPVRQRLFQRLAVPRQKIVQKQIVK